MGQTNDSNDRTKRFPIATTNNVPLTMKTYYYDFDGDKYHGDTRQATTNPGARWSLTTNGPDCNDNNLYNNIDCRQSWYTDVDGDGYHGKTERSDTEPEGGGWIKGRSYGQDCDDNVPSIENICGNGGCNTSAGDLQKLFPLTDAKAKLLADTINKFSKFYGINTKEKLQHFLAQAGVETKNFNSFRESTNFQPQVVMAKFSKYFNSLKNDNKDPDKANLSSIYIVGQKYVDGEKLFNIVYDDRNPNRSRYNLLGNTQNGDGYKFRGRGALHLTGRDNYTKFTEFYNNISGDAPKDFTQTPNDLVDNLEIAIHAGMWFFQTKVMGGIDNFNTKILNTDPAIIDKLTIKISNIVNGGDNALQDRVDLLNDSKTKMKCN